MYHSLPTATLARFDSTVFVAVWNETWARFFQFEYAQITYSFDVHSFDLRAVPGTEACSCWCRDTTSAIPGHSNQMFVMASG